MGYWLGLFLLLLMGCATPLTKPSNAANLRLEISGLAGDSASLVLSGNNFRQNLQSSQTLELPAGSYQLEGFDVLHNGQIYSPQLSSTLILQPQQTLQTQVTYRKATGVQGSIATPVLEASYVEGEALVKWRGVAGQSLGSTQPELVKRGISAQSGDGSTLEWIAQLKARPDVEYAEPNYRRFVQQTPNDPLHSRNALLLEPIKLNQAWQQSTGSSQVTVAVLDTGILWRQNDPAATHPDLNCGRVLPGYDFVSYLDNGDGNGRDADPYSAPGDDHGTQVAGLIGACSNNGLGIAGMDWNARIVPVRVLGKQGGTDSDIIAGLRWAAGLAVPGVPTNPNPAKVINLSFAGPSSRALSQAIEQIVLERNVIAVAAAGNHNDQALRYGPANGEQVIAVGSTDAAGQKASFSNYGAGVRVLAPGVNILSLGEGNGGERFGYRVGSGTSLSAPIVSAAVALMAALKPDLTWVEASAYLTRSAVGMSSCDGCGGRLDAAQALMRTAQNQAVGAFTTPAVKLDLESSQTNSTLTLRNYGDQPARINAANLNGLQVSPASATIAPGGEQQFILTLGQTANGRFYRVLELGQTSVLLQYQSGSGVADVGTVQVALCQTQGDSARLIRRATAVYNNGYRYGVSLENTAGSGYYLRAWVDQNQDGTSEFATGRVALERGVEANLALSKTAQRLSEGGCLVN